MTGWIWPRVRGCLAGYFSHQGESSNFLVLNRLASHSASCSNLILGPLVVFGSNRIALKAQWLVTENMLPDSAPCNHRSSSPVSQQLCRNPISHDSKRLSQPVSQTVASFHLSHKAALCVVQKSVRLSQLRRWLKLRNDHGPSPKSPSSGFLPSANLPCREWSRPHRLGFSVGPSGSPDGKKSFRRWLGSVGGHPGGL